MKPSLVTFDVYMALMDIQGGLVPVLGAALGLPPEKADPLVRQWRAKQMELAAVSNSLGKGRRTFRDCTRLGLDYVLGTNDLAADAATRNDLVMAWDGLKPWPEAVEVVAAVKARGFATAILSNGDQDMLDALARNFGDDMDHVLSSETAGWYKPHPAVYELPERIRGTPLAETLHVAGSPNDVLGAGAFGMACYWSNRTGDLVADPAYGAAHEGRDLTGVLAVLDHMT